MVDKLSSGLFRRTTSIVLGVLVCLAAAVLLWRHSVSRAKWQQYVSLQHGSATPAALDEHVASQIEAFCGDCHGMPVAGNYPRDTWHFRVLRGYEYYARSGRNDLDPPPMYLTVDYFRSRAPEQVEFPEPEEAQIPLRALFTTERVTLEKETAVRPGISFLRWTDLKRDGQPVLLACDMKRGGVFALDLRDRHSRLRTLTQLENPCHVEPCDLDGDGAVDLVVAELGSFRASDHDRGKVVWLRRRDSVDDYEKIVLASGLGRIADVRPADFDGDGDVDLVVAEFGHRKTGKIFLFRNMTEASDRPHFEIEVVDSRPGPIHVPVHDLNGDGHPDFFALVSQEYECVAAFLNQGNAQFRMQTLWAAPDPTFGSTGIQLVDLDKDGDMDVLYTNGDTFDEQYIKPTHGIQWLENLGGQQFAYRRLTDMPGVHRALAGDIDLDGDLDIIASSWLHDQLYPENAASRPMASIVCLEQTSAGVFAHHTLEVGFPCHAALELADFDNDGDLDFAVGWQLSEKWRHLSHWLTVWWNQTVSEAKAN